MHTLCRDGLPTTQRPSRKKLHQASENMPACSIHPSLESFHRHLRRFSSLPLMLCSVPQKHSLSFPSDSLRMVTSRRRWGEHGRMLVAQFSEFTTWLWENHFWRIFNYLQLAGRKLRLQLDIVSPHLVKDCQP